MMALFSCRISDLLVYWMLNLALSTLCVESAIRRRILYPTSEYNYSGVELMPGGINVCQDRTGKATCCAGYERENEFGIHCLIFQNETEPIVTNYPLYDGCAPSNGIALQARNCSPAICPRDDIKSHPIDHCVCHGALYQALTTDFRCTPCPDGTKGENCRYVRNVPINDTCRGRGRHSVYDDRCNCQYGWSGLFCETRCDGPDSYAQAAVCRNCANVCNGHVACMYNIPSQYNIASEVCLCPAGQSPGTAPPGESGVFCNRVCTGSEYGHNCMYTCSCQHGACSNSVGCVCDAGFMGVNCSVACPRGYYGPGCNSTCGQCLFGCNPATGQCNPCQLPYIGNGTVCEPCTCTGPGATCIPDQFHCGCPNGEEYRDGQCRACLWNQFTPDATSICQPCHCRNNRTCNAETGICDCDKGYVGGHCETKCSAGLHGIYCREQCSVHCPLLNTVTNCHHETGMCICPPGVFGDICDRRCPEAWHFILNNEVTGGNLSLAVTQSDADRCLPCTCHAQNSLSCNETGGECECKPGWTQESDCKEPCPPAFYGAGCALQCSCHHGNCSAIDGSCTCPPGYHGARCGAKCGKGSFGHRCKGFCDCGSVNIADDKCDHVTGKCSCDPGYTGDQCDTKCSKTTYGERCGFTCDCRNNATCHHATGTCECPVGYTGDHCDHKVNPTGIGGTVSPSSPPIISGSETEGAVATGSWFEKNVVASIILGGGLVLAIFIAVVVGVLHRHIKRKTNRYRHQIKVPGAVDVGSDSPSKRVSMSSSGQGSSRQVSLNPNYDTFASSSGHSDRNPGYKAVELEPRPESAIAFSRLESLDYHSVEPDQPRAAAAAAHPPDSTTMSRRSDIDDLSLGKGIPAAIAPRPSDYHILKLDGPRHSAVAAAMAAPALSTPPIPEHQAAEGEAGNVAPRMPYHMLTRVDNKMVMTVGPDQPNPVYNPAEPRFSESNGVLPSAMQYPQQAAIQPSGVSSGGGVTHRGEFAEAETNLASLRNTTNGPAAAQSAYDVPNTSATFGMGMAELVPMNSGHHEDFNPLYGEVTPSAVPTPQPNGGVAQGTEYAMPFDEADRQAELSQSGSQSQAYTEVNLKQKERDKKSKTSKKSEKK